MNRSARLLTGLILLPLAGCASGSGQDAAQPPPGTVPATGPVTASVTAPVTSARPAPATSAAPPSAPAVPAGTATRLAIANPGQPAFITTAVQAYAEPDDGLFNPGQGVVAWWARNGYGAPGQSRTSVLAGHVTFGGAPDVFHRLGTARPGAIITVSYSSGATATWKVTEVLSAPKEEIASYQTATGLKVWSSPGLRLITCDQASGLRPDGHTRGNTVVLADRAA